MILLYLNKNLINSTEKCKKLCSDVMGCDFFLAFLKNAFYIHSRKEEA